MLLLPALSIAFITGLLLVSVLWPDKELSTPCGVMKCSLAVGLGFGVSSVLFFVWLVIQGFRVGFLSFVILEIAVLCLAFLGWFRKRERHETFCHAPESAPKTKLILSITLFFYCALIVAVLSFILMALKNPHGGWDAWAIWNLKARFLFRGTDHWTDIFSKTIAHPDYPLLLPGFIARCWKYVGSETTLAPIAVSFLFTFATAGLLCASLSILRSRAQAFLAGLVLLAAAPFLIMHGVIQYADTPLSFFFLACVILFCLNDKSGTEYRHAFLVLAGMAAGCAAWTKNEGLLFLVSIVAVRFLVIVPTKGLKEYVLQMGRFMAGALPFLITVGYFKMRFALSNELIASQNFGAILGKISDPSRYLLILKAFAIVLSRIGFQFIGTIPVMAVYLLLVGVKVKRGDGPILMTCFATLLFMMAGYFFVYVITPEDLAWHLNTSLVRLMLQLWPTLLFALFMAAKTPEDMALSSRPDVS